MLLSGVGLIGTGAATGPITLGFLLAGLGAYLVWRGRPQSQVRLQSASGEMKAFSSYDDAHVRRVVEALTESIVFRG